MKRITGVYETLGALNYFVPYSLPPKDPLLSLSPKILELYGQAMLRLGELSEMGQRLPDINRFVKAYVIKEALLSSAIEGIHTTWIDVLTHSITESKPNKETQLVLNYTQAMEAALTMVQQKNLPISSRVILAAHEVLMSQGAGDRANPGQYRQQSVRVGNLIPPPAPHVSHLMSELEHFINADQTLPALIKAGLAHVQFETIHPFLDGNGRIGRLLIVLMLINENLLSVPILYPSYYFKKHHHEYYVCLDKVRTEGDFEGWIEYYLKAIVASANDALKRAKDIELLEAELNRRIIENEIFDKDDLQGTKTLLLLFKYPIISISKLAQELEKSYNTAASLVEQFVKIGILTEPKEQKRNKLFRFTMYLNLLEKEYPEI